MPPYSYVPVGAKNKPSSTPCHHTSNTNPDRRGESRQPLMTPRWSTNTKRAVALGGSGYEGVVASLFDQIDALAQFVGANALRVALNVLESILRVLVFVIALFYLLRDGPRFTSGLRELVPGGQRDELVRLGGRINLVLGQYVRGQVVLIAIMASATTIGLSLLQVPFSYLLG